jgi:mannosyltransferase
MPDPSSFISALATIAVMMGFLFAAYNVARVWRVWAADTSCITLSPPALMLDSHNKSAWRHFIPAAIATVGVGAMLRLIGITHQSLWLDEAFSAYVAAHRFPEILTFVSSSDAHPPLYYLLLHVWLILGPSVLAMRLLSAIASIASLLPMYWLGRRLANQRVALLATILMSFSAFQVWYAQEVRMYALTTLAIVMAMYAFVRAWQEVEVGFWVLFTCSMLAAFYLDYSALYVYSALVLWFALVGWRNVHMRTSFALSGIVLFLGYLPWLPMLWQQLSAASGATAWISDAVGTGLISVLSDLFFNRTNLLQPDAGTMAVLANTWSLVILAAVLWLPRRASAYPLLAIWACWPLILGMIAGWLNHPILIARTMMVVQPALFLLLALSADVLWRRRRNSRLSWSLLLALALCFAIFLTTNTLAQVASWSTTLKEDWRGAAKLVATNQSPGDLVLFNAYFVQMPFDYYYHQDGALQGSIVERGYQTEETLLFADLIPPDSGVRSGSDLSGYAHVWLIVSHSGGADETVISGLSSHYEAVRQWQYPGITVQLYQER